MPSRHLLVVELNDRACLHASLPRGLVPEPRPDGTTAVVALHVWPDGAPLASRTLSWDGTISRPGILSLPAHLAREVALEAGAAVWVEAAPAPPRATRVELRPETAADLLALLASGNLPMEERLDYTFLEQAALAVPGQTLPLLVGRAGGTAAGRAPPVRFRVTACEPAGGAVALWVDLELHIIPVAMDEVVEAQERAVAEGVGDEERELSLTGAPLAGYPAAAKTVIAPVGTAPLRPAGKPSWSEAMSNKAAGAVALTASPDDVSCVSLRRAPASSPPAPLAQPATRRLRICASAEPAVDGASSDERLFGSLVASPSGRAVAGEGGPTGPVWLVAPRGRRILVELSLPSGAEWRPPPGHVALPSVLIRLLLLTPGAIAVAEPAPAPERPSSMSAGDDAGADAAVPRSDRGRLPGLRLAVEVVGSWPGQREAAARAAAEGLRERLRGATAEALTAWRGRHVDGGPALRRGVVLSFDVADAASALAGSTVHLRVEETPPPPPPEDGTSPAPITTGREDDARLAPDPAPSVRMTPGDQAAAAPRPPPPWVGDTPDRLLTSVLIPLRVALRLPLSSAALPHGPAGVLLAGPRGSGRSALLEGLARALPRLSPPVHAEYLDLGDHLGGDHGELGEALVEAFRAAAERAPAVLLLDNLDLAAPPPEAGAESHPLPPPPPGEGGDPLAGDAGSVPELLAELIREARATCHGCLQVVAVVRDPAGLPGDLAGPDLFGTTVSVSAPDPAIHGAAVVGRAVRASGAAITDAEAAEAVTEGLAGRLAGFDASDLGRLGGRAVVRAAAKGLTGAAGAAERATAATGRGRVGPLRVRPGDVSEGFRGLVAGAHWSSADVAGGRGVPTWTRASADGSVEMSAADRAWAVVGGLANARAELREALELPLRLPAVFAAAPVRVSPNVLLYGPPGCGKTLLATTAVAGASLRSVTIRGAELLSKYIGASEAAVRETFARAASVGRRRRGVVVFPSLSPPRVLPIDFFFSPPPPHPRSWLRACSSSTNSRPWPLCVATTTPVSPTAW